MPEQVNCANFETWSVLYTTGELGEPVRAAVEAHARHCSVCGAVLEREQRLCQAIAERGDALAAPDRSDLLLAHCRSELSEALDDTAPVSVRGRKKLWPWLNWTAAFRHSLEFHPGWSAVALLLAGALAGLAGRQWYGQALRQPGPAVMTISAASPVSDQDLATIGIEDIRWENRNGASPQVELQLRAERPVVLQGSPNDSEIRRVLAYVVENGPRFDPGLRLDSLELLRAHAADPRVNGALRRAVQRDPNPAVRLRALESLRDLGADPGVRQTLLQALARDENSGVRIEAVNALLAALRTPETSAAWPDADAVAILRDRVRNDPNNYVRLRSATALAQLISTREDSSPEPFRGGLQP